MSDPPATPPTNEPRPHPRRPVRSVPSSRAYWELKAEQMMNRIFDPEAIIDLPVAESPAPPRAVAPPADPTPPPAPAGPAPRPRRQETPVLLLSVLGGVCMVSAISTSLYLASWNQAQQNLRQERNLLLVERLRSLGPIQPPPVPAAPQLPAPAPVVAAPLAPALGSDPQEALGDDAPPPPQEAWIEELSALPEANRRAPLRVPLSPRLATASPPRPLPVAPPPPVTATRASGPPPVLVGVVAAAGRSGSAIFQVGSLTTSVGVGEAIGGSGWRLRATGGDTAEIERDGEVRRVTISTGG